MEATMLVPAMRQLNDPMALALLRAMYECLASADLHHCRNCDEEWVVFNTSWPQAGAGMRRALGWVLRDHRAGRLRPFLV